MPVSSKTTANLIARPIQANPEKVRKLREKFKTTKVLPRDKYYYKKYEAVRAAALKDKNAQDICQLEFKRYSQFKFLNLVMQQIDSFNPTQNEILARTDRLIQELTYEPDNHYKTGLFITREEFIKVAQVIKRESPKFMHDLDNQIKLWGEAKVELDNYVLGQESLREELNYLRKNLISAKPEDKTKYLELEKQYYQRQAKISKLEKEITLFSQLSHPSFNFGTSPDSLNNIVKHVNTDGFAEYYKKQNANSLPLSFVQYVLLLRVRNELEVDKSRIFLGALLYTQLYLILRDEYSNKANNASGQGFYGFVGKGSRLYKAIFNIVANCDLDVEATSHGDFSELEKERCLQAFLKFVSVKENQVIFDQIPVEDRKKYLTLEKIQADIPTLHSQIHGIKPRPIVDESSYEKASMKNYGMSDADIADYLARRKAQAGNKHNIGVRYRVLGKSNDISTYFAKNTNPHELLSGDTLIKVHVKKFSKKDRMKVEKDKFYTSSEYDNKITRRELRLYNQKVAFRFIPRGKIQYENLQSREIINVVSTNQPQIDAKKAPMPRRYLLTDIKLFDRSKLNRPKDFQGLPATRLIDKKTREAFVGVAPEVVNGYEQRLLADKNVIKDTVAFPKDGGYLARKLFKDGTNHERLVREINTLQVHESGQKEGLVKDLRPVKTMRKK